MAGLIAGRFAGISGGVILAVALGLVAILWVVWVDPLSTPRRTNAFAHSAGGALAGWGIATTLLRRGVPGWAVGAALAGVLALTVGWEFAEFLGDRALDTALVPSRLRLRLRHLLRLLRRRRRDRRGADPHRPALEPRRSGWTSLPGMSDLEGRVIAIAGAGRRPRPGRRPPARRRRRHPRPDRRRLRTASTRSSADLGLADRPRRRPRRRPARRRRRGRLVQPTSSSASARSTASSIWSAAGRAASRSRPPRSPTTSGSTTCSCAPVQHATRAFHDALAASRARPLRARLLLPGAGARRHQRLLRARPRPPPRPGRSPSPTPSARPSPPRPRTSSSSTRSSPRRCARQSPDKPYKTFTSAEDIADAIAFICSDGAAKMNGKRLELHS